MKRSYLSGLGLGACLLAACGSQASPDYVGESLLTLKGKVDIEGSKVDGPLRPALAFRSRRTYGDQLHFLEVDIEGQFPSDFTLRVMEPPPKVVIDRAKKWYEPGYRLPPFPVAYITAVSDELPDAIDAEPATGWGSHCIGDFQEPCKVTMEWCLNGRQDIPGGVCYYEDRECAPGTLRVEDCTYTGHRGNPDVREYPWQRLAGMSEELKIIWLDEPLAEDDPVAVEFGLPALDAGYHAFEVIGPTDQEREAGEQCIWDATELSIQEYNEEHETDWTLEDFMPCTSELGPRDECYMDGELAALNDAIGENQQANLEQLGCDWNPQNERRLLSEEETQHISVRIAPDVRPKSERGRW